MAGSRIKGITIELDGDTTKLTNALKNVEKEVRSTQMQLKDVNKLLKLDPGNTDLLKQKYSAMGKEIEATKQKLSTLKEAQKQMVESGKVDTEQYDALQREITETEQKLKGLTKEYENFGSVSAQKVAAAGQKVQDVGNKMAGVGTKMTMGVTAPIVAGAASAVKSFGDVDKQFNLVKQTMGNTSNTAKDFEGLWKQIGTSAKSSVYGMQDATDATLNFARQGFTAKQATDMLTPAMSLAAATGTDLSEVTSGLGNSLKMFGANSSEASKYSDVLAKAQAQANTTTSELFSSISVAGPICKTVGWDVKDLATLTGVFGNAGISGSEGANALKTGLARLASPASEGAKAMDKLGLSTGQTYAIFNDNGTLKSMPEVIANLNSAFSGLTDQEKLEAASNIYGKNQMSKWLTLIQSSPEEVSGLRSALDDVTGSSKGMADALMSGTGGTIEQLKSTFDVLKVTVGEAVAPAFQRLMENVIGVMNKFMELDPATQKLITTIAGIAAAVGPALIVIGKMASGVGAVMKLAPQIAKIPATIGKLKGVFTGLWGVLSANPIMLVIAAVAALVLGFIALWNKSEAFRNFWIGLWDGIKSIVSGAVEGIKGFFKGIGDFAGGLKDSLGKTWNTIKTNTGNVFNGIKTTIGGAWDKVKSNTSAAWDNIKASVQAKGGGIKGVIGTALEGYKNVWKAGFDVINKLTGGKLGNALSSARTKLGEMKNAFSEKMGTIKNVVSGGLDKVKNFFSGCKLSLPKIKLPHFKITGKLSIKPPSVPKLSVDWYKKAYDNAVMFDSPTVLGTPAGMKGFGDGNGSELVVGTDRLMGMISSASGSEQTVKAIQSLGNQLLSLMGQYFPQMSNTQVVLDSGTLVGSIAPQMNRELGVIAGRRQRG